MNKYLILSLLERHEDEYGGDVASVSGDKGKTPECQELLRRFRKNSFSFFAKAQSDGTEIDVDELPLYADEEHSD